jgi:carbamoyltransferase
MVVLGISGYYHDSAAAVVRDGLLIAAAQEERFTRKKHDACFPSAAIRYCLQAAEIELSDVQYIVFYDKPFIKFERLLETYLGFAPAGLRSFLMAMPIWLKDKLFLKNTIMQELATIANGQQLPPLLFTEHHESHAASAFYPSPFHKAAVLCMDGVGEWATCSVWRGNQNNLSAEWELQFPHSLGLLYSAFTYYTGFKVNSGEYKLMGLAPYGEPRFADTIRDNLIDIKPDGTFRLNMKYFSYATGLTMTSKRFDRLFGGPPRSPETPIRQRDMDLARSIQLVTEEIVLALGQTVHRETGEKQLCLAGGVALNCVANGRLLREGPFDNIWIQPAAGDAGGAIGAALAVWHSYLGNERPPKPGGDAMQGAYLGPSWSEADAREYLDSIGAKYHQLPDSELFDVVATHIASGAVTGWHQGRMEFGPRALGNRSILGDPRSPKMQTVMNLKIKERESFRPFAPAILAEDVSEWFDHTGPSPYMLLVADVLESRQRKLTEHERSLVGLSRLNAIRSEIPAVTHVDNSARLQTVHTQTNPRFHRLLSAFKEQTGCPILVNTSFNVRGEPIVASPEDAYRCFMRTQMDVLVVGNLILRKEEQPNQDTTQWNGAFELD